MSRHACASPGAHAPFLGVPNCWVDFDSSPTRSSQDSKLGQRGPVEPLFSSLRDGHLSRRSWEGAWNCWRSETRRVKGTNRR